jgi:hypothetical protein
MKGQGATKVIANNLHAGLPDVFERQRFATRFKMCWKCQKNKSPIGGHIKTYPGLMKFICKDCMDAKAKTSESAGTLDETSKD